LGDYVHIINWRTVAISLKTSSAVDEIRVITKATTNEASGLMGLPDARCRRRGLRLRRTAVLRLDGGRVLNQPVVAGVNTCGNAGYGFVASDGGVFSYGDAIFHGSLGGQSLHAAVVGMAATPTDTATTWSSQTARCTSLPMLDRSVTRVVHLNRPIVGMAVTPSGFGYWLVASDGGIFAYGDATAHFYSSTGGIHLVSPIIGISAAIDSLGYYLYAKDGGMFVFQQRPPFGPQVHEPFFGSAGGSARANPIVGARLAADGQGYWFDDSAGIIYNFGLSAPKATPVADMSAVALFRPMIGMM
jgi:hypothetical protein